MFEVYSGKPQYVTHGVKASQSMQRGQVVKLDSGLNKTGYIKPAVVNSAVVYGVWLGETGTSSATSGATTGVVAVIDDTTIWKVDTSSTLTMAEIGTVVSLADSLTIDEDDTANTPLFEITGYFGNLTDKKALGKFVTRLIDSSGDDS